MGSGRAGACGAALVHLEKGHGLHQLHGLAAQVVGSGGAFFDQGGVLLGGAVHLRDGFADLAYTCDACGNSHVTNLATQSEGKLVWKVDQSYWERRALKPGVTGLAQIRGYRGATDREIDLTNRLQSDLEYIAKWSMAGDLWIILRTVGVLIHPRAY